ncbi:MAG: ABC transporter ATP-binding protein [Acidimicrobiales bacterium]|jgi:molybdate transport system ATP-binding protein|nr:ABC transporter ATP-binding protein [Acidimicrobiales bacterium]
MSLQAAMSLRLGELVLDVELDARPGTVTAVLGPNGAGKTTLLRTLAGLHAVDTGAVTLDGVVLDRPPDIFVVPERRRIGVVHQDYLLFPHLSVLDNVAFGPRSRGRSVRESRSLATGHLARLGIAELAHVRPRALSGGQAQRVALVRALATEPRALLLDEPLAALDAGTRVETRRDLRRYLAEFAGPTLLVTHDPVDALTLADRVAVLERGRITQVGTLAEVTGRPRTRYVAELIGTNLVQGTAQGTAIRTDAGSWLTTAESHIGPVLATIAPAAVALHRHEPEGSPRNRWVGTVAHLDLLGDRVRVQLAGPLPLVAEVTPSAVSELALREGDPVWASVKATEITTYPA